MREVVVVVLLGACGRVGFDPHATDAVTVPSVNRVFVTSTQQAPGAFTGIAGGDAVCAERAAAAQLEGTFIAWLSTEVPAAERLAGKRGWTLVDGQVVADQVDELLTQKMRHPIGLDEFGNVLEHVEGDRVATGTRGTGEPLATCEDYVASASNISLGLFTHTGVSWSRRAEGACTDVHRLYCFQIDFAEPAIIARATGRTAFLSITDLVPSAGLAAADALCMADAQAFGVPGTFQALLPGDDIPAAERFDLGGAPWVRLDGIALAPTARDFMEGRARASLNVDASGDIVTNDVMTGIDRVPVESPLADRTCNAWTDAGGGVIVGDVDAVGQAAFHRVLIDDCVTPRPIYCLEK